MPYAPGIQDISGQLIGEGMTRASNIKAQARSDFGRTIADTLIGGIKQYQQNENFTAQSLAKFTERMQDPQFKQYVDNILADDTNKMGVPESVKTAFRNAQTGKLKPNEASTLATIAQDYSERKKAAEESDVRKQQAALVFAQAANQQASAEETRLKNQAMESARKQLESEGMNLNAPIQRATPAAPPESVTRFLDTNQLMPAGTPFDPRANQMIAGYAEKPQAVAPARPLIGDADIKKQARIAQLTEQSSTGVMKPLAVYEAQINASLLKQKQDLRAQEAAERADVLAQRTSEAEMTQPQAMKQAEALNKQYPESVFTVEPGANARSYVIKQSAKPDVLKEQKVMAFEAELKPAVKSLEAITTNANMARNDIPRQDRILEALKEGATTGYGSELSMKARSMLAGTGLINNKKLGRDQILYSDLAIDALLMTKDLLSGQGSVSNEERKRVDTVAANIEKDPTAIYQLIKIKKAATDRAIAAEDYKMSLDDKIDPNNPRRLIEINKLMNKWYKDNTLTSFEMSKSERLLQEKTK